MTADLTAAQFNDWLACYEAEPWGEERADMRMARQVWASLAPHVKKPPDENKYRFKFEAKVPPTPEQYRAKSMRAYAGHGGFHARPAGPKPPEGTRHV